MLESEWDAVLSFTTLMLSKGGVRLNRRLLRSDGLVSTPIKRTTMDGYYE